MPVKASNGFDCYNYLAAPVPLIPKNLAEYEPPRMAYDFPFLILKRMRGYDEVYQQGKEVENPGRIMPPEGSLRSSFEKNGRKIVYRRNANEHDNYESNHCDIRRLLKNASAKAKPGENTEATPYYTLSDPSDKTLLFESRFESGNLNHALKINDNEYNLSMQNDINSAGNTQWFYFRVQNTTANSTVQFNILNFGKNDSLFNHGMKVLCYSEIENSATNKGWFRDGTDISYFNNGIHKNTSGKSYYTLSYKFKFPHTNDTVYFAYGYPYTYTDLMEDLADIEKDPFKNKVATRKLVCNTIAGNRCEVLTVTSPGTSEGVNQRRGAVITARVHPGETVGSWMMKGVIDFLTSDTPEAKQLRDNYVFKIIPMLNPDGVIAGNYRTSLVGNDLNRRWKKPNERLHPTIFHAKAMIKDFGRERPIDLVCDLHGHSKRKNVFMYGCNVPGQPEVTRAIPYILSKISPFFLYDYCRFKVQRSKESTMRVALFKELRCPYVYTMESTFCGPNFGPHNNTHMTMENLMQMGASLCRALLGSSEASSPSIELKPYGQSGESMPVVSASEIMTELLETKELLEDPEEDSSSGSDSDPSEDNLEIEELKKFVPLRVKPVRKGSRKSTSVRRRSLRSVSAKRQQGDRSMTRNAKLCSKCNEPWARGHTCPMPEVAEAPKPVRKTPMQRAKTVGVLTYYNSNGKKVHDQYTQTYKSILQSSLEENRSPEKNNALRSIVNLKN